MALAESRPQGGARSLAQRQESAWLAGQDWENLLARRWTKFAVSSLSGALPPIRRLCYEGLVIAGRALLLDFASTHFFLAVYALTESVVISVSLGIALASAQFGWRLVRREKSDALQSMSLAVVIVSGCATLWAHNPVFVMLKPSAIYVLVGGAMLQRGWMLALYAATGHGMRARYGDHIRLRLGGADVLFRHPQSCAGPQSTS